MSSLEEILMKRREERIAREKSRIEKLRELNLKKYSKNEPSNNNILSTNKLNVNKSHLTTLKKNINGNHNKRPSTAPFLTKGSATNKVEVSSKNVAISTIKQKTDIDSRKRENNTNFIQLNKKNIYNDSKGERKGILKKELNKNENAGKPLHKNISKIGVTKNQNDEVTKSNDRRSVLPAKLHPITSKSNSQQPSVFERLYKPKLIPKITNGAEKLKTDSQHSKKIIENSKSVAQNKQKTTVSYPVRRSISALHFKKINETDKKNFVHKWASIGEKLEVPNLNNINEDNDVKCKTMVSAVKSERKQVQFQSPATSFNFFTPQPEELQAQLQKWLQKQGKTLDSYHHLQCFGIYHLPSGLEIPKLDFYDEENKENLALESDTDNQSYTDNLNDREDDFNVENKGEAVNDKWRSASILSENVSLNNSKETTLTSEDTHPVDDLILGTLNDLVKLLNEGFDWEQCACWLRAIRARFPSATKSASYWECRAVLEERRGDYSTSMQCWGEALAVGADRSVAEANLDQLLNKFMQLKISPKNSHKKPASPRMVSAKNIFKSTIIRFAVHQAKLRQSNQHDEAPKCVLTPVRRSGRLSMHHNHSSAKRTPLQLFTSITQAARQGAPVVFIPNDKLFETP